MIYIKLHFDVCYVQFHVETAWEREKRFVICLLRRSDTLCRRGGIVYFRSGFHARLRNKYLRTYFKNY